MSSRILPFLACLALSAAACGSETTASNNSSSGAATGGAMASGGAGGRAEGGMGGAYVPECGNLIIDPGEQCDDGNNLDGDTCETDCSKPACQNGIVDGGESCFKNDAWLHFDVQLGFGHTLRDMSAVDCDGDQDLDIIALGYKGTLPQGIKVRARRNLGNGTFPRLADTSEYTQGALDPLAIIAADFNTETGIDLAVLTETKLIFLAGDGNCNWSYITQINLPYPAIAFAAANLDGDSRSDIIVALDAAPYDRIAFFLSSTQTLSAAINSVSSEITDLIAADFNNDGKGDIAYTDRPNNAVWTRLWLGGSFSNALQQPKAPDATGIAPFALAAGDFNYDGFNDIIVANYLDNNVSSLENDGATAGLTFVLAHPHASIIGNQPNEGRHPIAIATADLDGDGDTDILVANEGNGSSTGLPSLTMMFTTGDSAYYMTETAIYPLVAESFPFTLEATPFAPHIVDMNNDGAVDLVVAWGNAIHININTP